MNPPRFFMKNKILLVFELLQTVYKIGGLSVSEPCQDSHMTNVTKIFSYEKYLVSGTWK